MKKIYITVFILSISFLTSFAQNQRLIDDAITRIGNGELSFKSLNKIIKSADKTGIDNIIRECSDTITERRVSAYILLKIVGKRTESGDVKQKCLKTFVNGLNDTDTEISTRCIRSVTEYDKVLINDDIITDLEDNTLNLRGNKSEIIRYFGYLGGERANRYLDKIAKEDTLLTNIDKWNIKLAKARCGDSEAANYCLTKVKRLSVNDDFIYEIVPDLIYTGNRQLIDYVADIMLSKEKSCSSANSEIDTKILCGYRIMEMLASVIVDFPVKIDDSGELDTDDYVSALKKCCNWIENKRDSYEILVDSYNPIDYL
ncbi:MAG: hypothetical protein N4A72_19235 [Bacteroidales bacterium]|jgi:hypothetical protein|nr:hypothetical protein [Bacteroidales bacterium]